MKLIQHTTVKTTIEHVYPIYNSPLNQPCKEEKEDKWMIIYFTNMELMSIFQNCVKYDVWSCFKIIIITVGNHY